MVHYHPPFPSASVFDSYSICNFTSFWVMLLLPAKEPHFESTTESQDTPVTAVE